MGVDKRPRLPARPRPPRTCPWRGGPPAPPPPPLCHQNHHNHRRRRRSNRKRRHLACVFSASRSTMERNAAVRTRRHLWPDGRTDGSLFETEKETEREREMKRERVRSDLSVSLALFLCLAFSPSLLQRLSRPVFTFSSSFFSTFLMIFFSK